jgi:hypothetical protein
MDGQQRRFICYSSGVIYSELDTPFSSITQAIKPLQSNDLYDRIPKSNTDFTGYRKSDRTTP